MKNRYWVIIESCRYHIKQTFARPTMKFCIFAQPILYTIIIYYMFKASGKENFAAYIVLGSGMMSLWSSVCFSSASDILREKQMGTIEMIFASPSEFKDIIFGKVLGNTFLGFISLVISFLFVKIFYKENIYINNLYMFILSLLLTIISFLSISMILAITFTLSRKTSIFMNCMEFPIFILSGMVVPNTMLPRFLIPFSYLLSPSWCIKILQNSIYGIQDYYEFMIQVLIALGISLIYLLISSKLFKVMEYKVRKTAALEVI